MLFGSVVISILILFILYYFFRGLVHKLMMKNFAKRHGFIFKNKLKKEDKASPDYETYFKFTPLPDCLPTNIIKGDFKGRSILIYDQIGGMGGGGVGLGVGGSTAKKTSFFIDGQRIFVLDSSEILLPFPGKLLKIIEDYVTRGILPEPKQKAGILVFIFLIFFTLFILIELLIHSNFKN
ncbi:MAG TPA: hypothetical protein VMD74_02160 [Candidatus Methylomirabilis sp.]|nr:hypothetical protein [Candidatus Methylomirabilis sp.]